MMSKSLPPLSFPGAICTMQGTHRALIDHIEAWAEPLVAVLKTWEDGGQIILTCYLHCAQSRYRSLNCREFYAPFTLLNSQQLGCWLYPHILFPFLYFQPSVTRLAVQLFFSALPGPANLDKKQTFKQIQLGENTVLFFQAQNQKPQSLWFGFAFRGHSQSV